MVREPFNAYSHAAGIVLGLVGTVVLALFSGSDLMKWVGALIYGFTMVLMYTSSTLYHALRLSEKALVWMRKLDHMAIFLFIAGSYTPVVLQGLSPTYQPWVLAVVWGLAGLGVLGKLITLKTPRWLYVASYLGLGWLLVFLMPKLHLEAWSFGFILAGGLAYSLGAIIYALKRPNPFPNLIGFHGVWHVCVLLGSLGMYFAVLVQYLA